MLWVPTLIAEAWKVHEVPDTVASPRRVVTPPMVSYRRSRLTTIFEGTSQIQQRIVADRLLPRSPLS